MTIHRKTAKGQHEIETRAHRLPPRVRSVLILVDGRRSDEALRQLLSPQADEALAALREQGFIEPAAAGPDEAAVPTAGSAPANALVPSAASGPAAAAAPFEQTRREAVRALNDLLGPLAEALALRMERARDAAELAPLLLTAVQVIADTRGRQAAQGYAERFSVAGPAGR